MQDTLPSHLDNWNRPVLLCDDSGEWPVVHWEGEPWSNRWVDMRRGEYGGLWLPPLLLPPQLGGWLLGMELARDNRMQVCLGEDTGMTHHLQLFGWVPELEQNRDCPDPLSVHLLVTVTIGQLSFHKEGKFKLQRGRSWSTALTSITSELSEHWPLPTIQLTVKP